MTRQKINDKNGQVTEAFKPFRDAGFSVRFINQCLGWEPHRLPNVFRKTGRPGALTVEEFEALKALSVSDLVKLV